MSQLKSKKQRKKVIMMLKTNDKYDRVHKRKMQRSDDAGIIMYRQDPSKPKDPYAIIGDPEVHHSKYPKRPDMGITISPLHNMFRKKRNERSDKKDFKVIGKENEDRHGYEIRVQRTGRGWKKHESGHILNALSMTNGSHIARLRQIKAKTKKGKNTLERNW